MNATIRRGCVPALVLASLLLAAGPSATGESFVIASTQGVGTDGTSTLVDPRDGTWGNESDTLQTGLQSPYVGAVLDTGPGSWERRSALEFELPDGVDGDAVLSATLLLTPVVTVGTPDMRFVAYEGDGSVGFADMTATGTTVLSIAANAAGYQDAISSIDVTDEVADLLDGGASHLGILIYSAAPGVQYMWSNWRAESAPELILDLVDNAPPTADAGDDVVVDCAGAATTVALDGSGSSDPDGDSLSYEWIAPLGSGVTIADPTAAETTGSFPDGSTLLTLKVTDPDGEVDFDDVLITVEDASPPLAAVTSDTFSLWPPNRKMVPVEVIVFASDACDAPASLDVVVTVSSSEPDGDHAAQGDVDGEDGYTAPVEITMTWSASRGAWIGTLDLRAERNTAAGRTYTIAAEVEDEAGNVSNSEAVVVVPHDLGRDD